MLSGSPKLSSKKADYPEPTMLDSSYAGALADQSSRAPQSSLPRCQCKWSLLESCAPAHPPAAYLSDLYLSLLCGAEEAPSWALPTLLTYKIMRYLKNSHCFKHQLVFEMPLQWPTNLYVILPSAAIRSNLWCSSSPPAPATPPSLFLLEHMQHAPLPQDFFTHCPVCEKPHHRPHTPARGENGMVPGFIWVFAQRSVNQRGLLQYPI